MWRECLRVRREGEQTGGGVEEWRRQSGGGRAEVEVDSDSGGCYR